MTDDDPENELLHDEQMTVMLSQGAYDALQDYAAQEERARIIAFLKDARHPMTHTAWALAKQIEDGEHLK